MVDECVFCKIVNKELPSDTIHESENFITIKDINPMTDGHSLVIPKEHYKNLLEIPTVLFGEYLDHVKEVSLKLLKKTNSEGFNLIMSNFEAAQQDVFHAHIHVVPRKKGDGEFKFEKP